MNYYELLELDPSCSSEEIKQKFRQQVALFHPDKVTHLAKQIQDLATDKTAELIEAYRVLGNRANRSEYDSVLKEFSTRSESNDRSAVSDSDSVLKTTKHSGVNIDGTQTAPDSKPATQSGMDLSGFLYDSAIARLRSVVLEQIPKAEEAKVESFDISFIMRSKWSRLFGNSQCARILARVTAHIDSSIVQDAWRMATKPGSSISGDTYLFLMGMTLENVSALSATILDLQRRQVKKENQTFFVPLKLNTWEVLIPNGAPEILRILVGNLRKNRG